MKLEVVEQDIAKYIGLVNHHYSIDPSIDEVEKIEKYIKMLFILLSKSDEKLKKVYEKKVYELFFNLKEDSILSLNRIYNINAFIFQLGFKTLEEYYAYDYSKYDKKELKKEYKMLKRQLIASKL